MGQLKEKFICDKPVYTLHRASSIIIILLGLCINNDAIRIYTGTTYQEPALKASKNLDGTITNSVISKRSWSPLNVNLEPTPRIEKRMDDNWREIDRRSTSTNIKEGKLLKVSQDIKITPNLYKVKLTQRGYIQFLKYLVDIPPLQEYTFCLWFTSQNLTHSHPLFSYSLNEKERILGLFINPQDSTIRMRIRNDIIFKVPVNIRENRWYHVCQSWSGLTGEWMVFLDGKKKGSGRLLQYQGTYVPGGGDIVVGQEYTDADKGLDDGIEGEIFGFNLVDESVDIKDQAVFLNPQYRREAYSQNFVPPFKKLPPIKKTFQEINAYLSRLPNEPVAPEQQQEAQTLKDFAEPNMIKTDANIVRSKPKRRYKPPLRKVVVYNRQDRQLRNEGKLEENLLLKKSGALQLPVTTEAASNEVIDHTEKKFKINQIYDINYSVHTYRAPKEKPKTIPYEIYEIQSDDDAKRKLQERSDFGYDSDVNQRRARQNFDLYTAREANKIYPLPGRIREFNKPRYHFERRNGKIESSENKRSFERNEDNPGVTKRSTDKLSEIPDFIPVYEIIEDDTPYPRRRKREVESKRDARQIETSTNPDGFEVFKPLPNIPDSFINLFTDGTPKFEIETKLNQFFPLPTNQTEKPKTIIVVNNSTNPILESAKATIQEEKQLASNVLAQKTPQNFPNNYELEKLLEPRLDLFKGGSVHNYVDGNRRNFRVTPKIKDANVEKGKIDVSSGTELVMRSYVQCGVERGSPVRNKKHLIVSWSETPVRIYGGAIVANAKNVCGHF